MNHNCKCGGVIVAKGYYRQDCSTGRKYSVFTCATCEKVYEQAKRMPDSWQPSPIGPGVGSYIFKNP